MAQEARSYIKRYSAANEQSPVKRMNMKAKAEEIGFSTCVEAKQTKSPSVVAVAKGVIDHVIHSDVIGPIRPR